MARPKFPRSVLGRHGAQILKLVVAPAEGKDMDGQIGSEWRRLEESVAEIGSFLEQLAGRVADWGRHLEIETGQMREDIGALTSRPREPDQGMTAALKRSTQSPGPRAQLRARRAAPR